MKPLSAICLMIMLLLSVNGSHAFGKVSDKEGLNILLLADEKDHGPAGNGLHDYPLWQEAGKNC